MNAATTLGVELHAALTFELRLRLLRTTVLSR